MKESLFFISAWLLVVVVMLVVLLRFHHRLRVVVELRWVCAWAAYLGRMRLAFLGTKRICQLMALFVGTRQAFD